MFLNIITQGGQLKFPIFSYTTLAYRRMYSADGCTTASISSMGKAPQKPHPNVRSHGEQTWSCKKIFKAH